MAEYIQNAGVEIHTSEEVLDVVVENGAVGGVVTARDRYAAENVILAPGRVGANWVGGLAQKYNLGVTQRGIEVGVRVKSTTIS